MTYRPTALERAFKLAKSGDYANVSELKAQLQAEGFSPSQLEGPTLLRQLRDLCQEAQKSRVE
jgi:hypothetical protein